MGISSNIDPVNYIYCLLRNVKISIIIEKIIWEGDFLDAVKINNLSFAYRRQVPIFENLNLTIKKGQFVGIVGPNGAGKSTLLKLILGLLTPRTGKITVLDEKIGYVSQRATAFNSGFPATVKEVLSAPLRSKNTLFQPLTQAETQEINKALEFVGLTPYKNELIGNLSGGQQQRTFIARALVTKPSILFLDEPFVGIDQDSQETISNLLHQLNKKNGTTIIIVTHDLRWVEQEVDTMVCIEAGTIHCHHQRNSLDDGQHILYHSHQGV